MSDFSTTSIAELARQIKERLLSPVEIVQAQLDKIQQLNSALNAVVTLAPNALDKARAAESALMRADKLGPLHGIPVTVKDTIETAGVRTTSGSVLRADFVPERDAPAVARLKAAGAIVIGKTNTAEMAMEYTADNPVFGRTNHPMNPALTPGGSSGGEAAAIASGMSIGGIGSDLAGSIRVPAHFCAVAALKPTVGRIPGGGQFPPSDGPYSLGAVIGPMARSIADLTTLFKVLADDVEPVAYEKCRAAFYSEDGVAPVTPETKEAVERVAQTLASAGMTVEERRPPAVDQGHELWLKLFSRASVVALRNLYQGHEEKAGEFVRWRLKTADEKPSASLDQYIQYWLERDRLRADLLRWMEDIPVLIAPVGATAAYEHGTHKVSVNGQTFNTFRAFSYAQTFNVFDLPVVVVRAGYSSEGLPIGVQIASLPDHEETILAVATIVERDVENNRY